MGSTPLLWRFATVPKRARRQAHRPLDYSSPGMRVQTRRRRNTQTFFAPQPNTRVLWCMTMHVPFLSRILDHTHGLSSQGIQAPPSPSRRSEFKPSTPMPTCKHPRCRCQHGRKLPSNQTPSLHARGVVCTQHLICAVSGSRDSGIHGCSRNSGVLPINTSKVDLASPLAWLHGGFIF